MVKERMRSRIEIALSLIDMMNLFFQRPDDDTHFGTLNAKAFYFHPSQDGGY